MLTRLPPRRIGEPVLGELPQPEEPVAKAHLFPFRATARMVGDRDLVNAGTESEEFCQKFGIHDKPARPKGNTLEKIAPDHFVTGELVRNASAIEKIRQCGDERNRGIVQRIGNRIAN